MMAAVSALSETALAKELASLPDWQLAGNCLAARFRFADFRHALLFMNLVGMECEAADHHPDWSNSYNLVKVSFTTHSAGHKVTELDVRLARYASKAAHELQGASHAD
jgi:4a-hydroxytetrahydrobiopterin dehydratase